MKKYTHNVPFGDGKKYTVVTFTRGGTKSPEADYVLVGERLVSPYEQSKKGPKWTVSSVLYAMYPPDLIKETVYANNPFFALLPKSDATLGGYSPIPITYKK